MVASVSRFVRSAFVVFLSLSLSLSLWRRRRTRRGKKEKHNAPPPCCVFLSIFIPFEKISFFRVRHPTHSTRRRRRRKETRSKAMTTKGTRRTGGVKSRRQQVLIRGFFDAISHLLDPGLIVDHGSRRARRDRDLSRRHFLGWWEHLRRDVALAGERRGHGQDWSHYY